MWCTSHVTAGHRRVTELLTVRDYDPANDRFIVDRLRPDDSNKVLDDPRDIARNPCTRRTLVSDGLDGMRRIVTVVAVVIRFVSLARGADADRDGAANLM